MTTSTDIEVVHLEEIVGDVEIPCDFKALDGDQCPDQPARWAMFVADHGCGSTVKMACGPCKDWRVEVEDGCLECTKCGHIMAPPRRFYSRIEAL